MSFLALLLGLAVERLVTHLFHLREFRWLDPLFDRVFDLAARRARPVAVVLLLAMAALLTLPVALVAWSLWDEFLQIPFFAFSVLVLLFALGPRDLDDEVEDYLAALPADDGERLQRVAGELLEREPPLAAAPRNEAVERAVFVQANNRVFAVVFWFLVAGPGGAWFFRVLDSMRRRLTTRHAAAADPATVTPLWLLLRELHAVVAWLPSRLLAAGYGLAGDFEAAYASWRQGGSTASLSLADGTETILARVGCSAAGRSALDPALSGDALERLRAARALVIRTLWMIWCPIIAVMTLYNWVA